MVNNNTLYTQNALQRIEVECEPPVLPTLLDIKLRGCVFVEIQRSYNAPSQVYRVTKKNAVNVYLKVGPNLKAERDRLIWLVGRLPVPRVKLFVTHQGEDYLLLSELSGKTADNETWRERADQVVRLFARAVRVVHAIDPNGCPFDSQVSVLLRIAKNMAEKGQVEQPQFNQAYRHMTPIEVYQRVLELCPPEIGSVFTHGDCCLPNILITNDCRFGFVDVGMAGVGDPWRDLALAIRSIRRNLGEIWVMPFLAEYGMEMDSHRMEFFNCLDQLVMARGCSTTLSARKSHIYIKGEPSS